MSAVCRTRTAFHRILRPLALAALAALLVLAWSSRANPSPGVAVVQAATAEATVIELNGVIGPALSRYVEQSINDAEQLHSPLIILQMDTPGGLDSSMRAIIKSMLASTVPVVTYVSPGGARAASAGTYILYASQVAAMAPGTNLGAATPISIGGESSGNPGAAPESEPARKSAQAPPTAVPENAGERKAVNDAVAYIRALAQLRSRNAEWAESAVRGAASLSAQDALAQHVIDLIAKDVPDLLSQLDGRRVTAAEQQITLHTRDIAVRHVTPDWRARLLMVLTHPTIAYGLLLIGIYGLLLEGYNPGVVLPGVVGALSLILALYSFELLAVNYAGLALVILGVGLIVLEFFIPAFGSLGVGGLVAFVMGSIILFDNPAQGFGTALPLIAGLAIAGALVIATIAWLAARARRRPVATGAEAMIGATVQVVSAGEEHCVVRYGGELWSAQCVSPLRTGQTARIVRLSGLTLWIEPSHS